MTQVANVHAGMGTATRTNAVSKQEGPKDLLAEFAGIMNQNAHNLFQAPDGFEDRMDSMTDRRVVADGSADTLEKDYAKLGSTGIRKIDRAQTERTGGEADLQKVQELAGQVKEAVQETMQVSAEEMEQAMETLGLGMLDLLLPQNLIRLAQELTGNTEVSALLTDGNFQMMMQEVTGLINDFQQDNGLGTEQFSDLLAQLSAQVDELEEQVKELLHIDEPEQATPQQTLQQTDGMQEIPVSGTEQMPKEQTAATVVEDHPEVQTVQKELQNVSGQAEAQEPDQTAAVVAEEVPEGFAQTKDQGEETMAQGEMNKQQPAMQPDERKTMAAEHHADVFSEHVMTVNEQTITTPETPQTAQTSSYVELEQLMNQMEGLARTFASAAGTTVEMQLNPENLGRLVLSVTEKHGNVTAQITASNEQVREALQTQMVELRSTLQAQGIKVEAVEVTVATHEFEQNLDGNTSANGQMQEQAGGQHTGNGSGRRNFHRNSLDELSGLMSEEEALVAQMMRDNGGTVDFTA